MLPEMSEHPQGCSKDMEEEPAVTEDKPQVALHPRYLAEVEAQKDTQLLTII